MFKASLWSQIKFRLTGKRHWYSVSATFYFRKGAINTESPHISTLQSIGLKERRQSTCDWRGIRKFLGPELCQAHLKNPLVKHLFNDGKIVITSINYLGYFK
jgi:hypothetical protein